MKIIHVFAKRQCIMDDEERRKMERKKLHAKMEDVTGEI